jgi:hypothetical protein
MDLDVIGRFCWFKGEIQESDHEHNNPKQIQPNKSLTKFYYNLNIISKL